MTSEKVKARAGDIAEELLRVSAGTEEQDEPLFGDNSRKRYIDSDLRTRFVELRSWMYRMGLVDPVLIRFDSYTVPQATLKEIAERLREIADSMNQS